MSPIHSLRARLGPHLTPTNLCCGLAIAALAAGLLFLARQGAADSSRAAAPDTRAARSKVWKHAEVLLAETERHGNDALDRHLASIRAFLDERKAGSRAFAERLLSLRGKWALVKAEIGPADSYAAFLQQAFAEHVFPMEELEKTVRAAVSGYLAELEGLDDNLLVRLRADLGDDELPRRAIPALGSDEALRRHYHALSERVAQDLRTDLAVVVGRELFLWEATTVATELTLQAGTALAARLGVSGAILSAGAASSWRTLGVGLVVAIVLDAVINRIIKAAGYDAEEQIAQRVAQTLSDLGRTLTDGDPAARDTLERLKTLQRDDPDPGVRAACAEAVRRIEAGIQLFGLRRELTALSAARASLRKETLRRLIHDCEVTP